MHAIRQNPAIDAPADRSTASCQKNIVQITAAGITMHTRDVLCEQPLSIRVQGRPYAVVMRTPGEEVAHAAGFCLGEGIIDAYDDIKQIGCCDTDIHVVTVTLAAARMLKAGATLERRSYISQSSCGICGKELIQDLIQKVRPLPDRPPTGWARLTACAQHFAAHQTLYRKTHASHAAVAFDPDCQPRAAGEDVGRHNAVDKVVGKLLMSGDLPDIDCLVLSSRISYELIQKIGRAGIPVVVAMSRPTALAVDLAEKLNISVVHLSGSQELTVYSGAHRIIHS